MLGWGQKGIDNFERVELAFLQGGVYREVTDVNSEPGFAILKLIRTNDIPEELEEIATGALLNIKHSFDRSLYAASRCLGRAPTGSGSINFPWSDTIQGCKGRVLGKRSKVPPELRSVVLSLEPYGRSQGNAAGDDISRVLAKMANRKHTIDLGMIVNAKNSRNSATMVNPTGFDISYVGSQWHFVEDEIIMARFAYPTQYRYEYDFDAGVCFNETRALKRIFVKDALTHFHAKAEMVLERFKKETIRICFGE